MRLLVVGLDGATFDIIEQGLKEGRLPTFDRLMKNGVHCDLISTIPPVSSPAWPSFMTGKNPGKHGVFDFVQRKGYEKKIKNAKDIKSKTIWKLLSENNKTCIVINVPVTHPPEEINGYIVTGMLTPPGACYTHPPEFSRELDKIGYKTTAKIEKAFSPRKILNYLVRLSSKRLEVALYLMKKAKWNFCMVVFRGTDVIQHNLWQFNREEILEYYQKIDVFIKELISNAGEKANTILMSDHGFGPVYKFFHVNRFLHDLGLLEFKTEASSGDYLKIDDYRFPRNRLQQILVKMGVTKENIYNIAKKLNMLKILQRMYKIAYLQVPTTKQVIDWNRTKAFFSSSVGPASAIEINLKGREPEGIVEKEEYEKIRTYIMRRLLKVEDPETGEKIVQDVFKREEIYHGPYLFEAPDIIFLTKNFEYGATDRIYGDSIVSQPIHVGRGTHRMNGIFIAYGPDVKNTGEEMKRARIIDLAPTFLHMFGVPVSEDMDGKVLTHIFKSGSEISKRKVRYQRISEKDRIRERVRKLKRTATLFQGQNAQKPKIVNYT